MDCRWAKSEAGKSSLYHQMLLIPKPLLGWQVIWDPGHIPKGVLALCADLWPWHDRDGWPHWWDKDWPGEPLLQQTPSHLWLAESIWDVSYSSHGDTVGVLRLQRMCWEGQPRPRFNISDVLHVSRASLGKLLTALEGTWGWGSKTDLEPRAGSSRVKSWIVFVHSISWAWWTEFPVGNDARRMTNIIQMPIS